MALITDLGVTGNGILQPKLKNRWRLTFIGIGDGIADGEGLQVQAITVDRPKLNFEKVTLDRYNSRAYIAAKHSFEPMNLVFEDDTGGAVAQALQNQLEKQQNIIGQFSSPLLPASAAGQLYKFAIRMDMLDGNETIFESWSIEGAWVENLNWNELDYSANEAMKISTTISYDHARQRLTGITYKANSAFGAL